MLIYIRGAGDLASGIALRLHHAGMQVVMSELKEPMAVRRTVSFSEAMRCGSCTVEEIRAKRAGSAQEARALAAENQIAVVWDPGADIFRELVLVNMPVKENYWPYIVHGLESFPGKVTFVYGENDPSYMNAMFMLPVQFPDTEIEVIQDADHHFTDHMDTFLDLPGYFTLEEKDD